MATFVATTASNGARLRDAGAASKVLDRYYWDGDVQAVIEAENGQYCLCIYGYDWPGAWKVPDGVDKEDFDPDYDVDPGVGFVDFLKKISPFLAEPLTIQSIGAENCRFPLAACEWHVTPGATEIEVNYFRHPMSEAGGSAGPTEDDLPSPDHITTV